MKRNLVKSVVVINNNDGKTMSVFDGTGVLTTKGGASEFIMGNELYYIPYAGQIDKSKFKELNILNPTGEITNAETIKKIKENIY